MTIDTTRVELRFSEHETLDGNVTVHCELPGICVSVHTGYDPHAERSQEAWHVARREAQLEMANWLRKLADIFESDADREAGNTLRNSIHRADGHEHSAGCNDPAAHEPGPGCSRDFNRGLRKDGRVLPLKRKPWRHL